MYPNINEVASMPIGPTGRNESVGRYHSTEVKGNQGNASSITHENSSLHKSH
jgi:hypothetical protein